MPIFSFTKATISPTLKPSPSVNMVQTDVRLVMSNGAIAPPDWETTLVLVAFWIEKWINISHVFSHQKWALSWDYGTLVLFFLRKLILQTRMRSHLVGLDVWFLVGPFVCFHTSCVRTAKALARLRGCAGSPEPLLVAYVINTIISRAGSNGHFHPITKQNQLFPHCFLQNIVFLLFLSIWC